MSYDLKPSNPNERKWGMVIHLAALTGFLLPLGLVLGPMLVWFLKRNDSEYFNLEGRKAINFQLTILILAFVFALLSILIRPLIAISFMAGLTGMLFAGIAGIKANNGENFNYPFSLKIL